MAKLPMALGMASLLALATTTSAPAAALLPAYFSPALPPFAGGAGCPALPAPSPTIPRRWFQQTQPPVAGNSCRTFVSSPLTDASDQLVSHFSTSTWKGGLWPRVWVLRGPRPKGLHLGDPASNPVYPYIHTPKCNAPGGPISPTMYLGLDYSSVDKANAATTAEVLRMLGVPAATWQAPLLAQKFNLSTDLVNFSALNQDPARFVDYKAGCNSHDGASFVLKDKFLVHDDPRWVYVAGKSTPPTGVMLDYEVNDFRSVAQGSQFLVGLAKQIHATSFDGIHPQAFLYTNPWEYVQVRRGLTGGMAANGFDYLTIDAVKETFDFFSLYLLKDFVCDINGSYALEIANIKGISGVVDPKKIVVTVDLTRCSVTNAMTLFQLNAAKRFAGYAIFPKDQLIGGQKLPLANGNQLIWTLLYGSKAPP